MQVGIIGAGVAGLTLALELHDAGIPCRVFEAVPEIRPVGVGITCCRTPRASWPSSGCRSRSNSVAS